MIECPQCKTQLSDSARFCGTCGAKFDEATPSAPVATPKKRKRALIVVCVIAAVLLGCGAAWSVFSRATGIKVDSVEIDTGRDDEPEASTATTPAGQLAEPMPAADTSADKDFALLTEHYAKLAAWNTRIGEPSSAHPSGGTGFYYEAFLPSIDSADPGELGRLKERCSALVAEVAADQGILGEAEVDPKYNEQRILLLSLYDWQVARARALYEAAMTAVDMPGQSAWRDTYEPEYIRTRDAFAADYPGAQPVLVP